MLFIGITGGVGAGKSEILRYLKGHYRCRVMLADEIAHLLMEPGGDCYADLRKLFARDAVFDESGRIVRPQMAKVLFGDEKKRAAVNDLVHPAVRAYVEAQAKEERRKERLDLLVLEAALLIEEHYDDICDELWYIYTSEGNRRQRLRMNRGYSDERIDGILASQLPEEVFRKHCAQEIDNNGLPVRAFEQIDSILREKGFRRI